MSIRVYKQNAEENDSSKWEMSAIFSKETIEIAGNNSKHDSNLETVVERDEFLVPYGHTNVEVSNVQMYETMLYNEIQTEEYKSVLNPKSMKEAVIWKQSLATSVPFLLTIVLGLTLGYSSTLIPQLEKEGGPIPSDKETISWIVSAVALPMAPGCLIAGWMLEKIGRRNSHYLVCLLFFVGWIFIAVANNVILIVAGRLLTGLCVGFMGPLSSVFIAEITSPKYRGFFLASLSLAIAGGILIVHVIGIFMSWQWTAAISSIFTASTVFFLVCIPESPTWLISKNRLEDGVASFYWLRGYGAEAKAEIKALIDSKLKTDNKPKTTFKSALYDLKDPGLLKPLFIMIILFLTSEFCGANAIAYYLITIIENVVGKDINNSMAMIVMDSLRLGFSIIACVICKQYDRRLVFILSGLITGLSLVVLSLFLYLKPANMSWFPLTCLMVYTCAITIGVVPLPWIICGEIFPSKFRGMGTGISSFLVFVASFIAVKTAPSMLSDLGDIFTFIFYGLVSLIGSFVLYFILPETNGKSLYEIEKQFVRTDRNNL